MSYEHNEKYKNNYKKYEAPEMWCYAEYIESVIKGLRTHENESAEWFAFEDGILNANVKEDAKPNITKKTNLIFSEIELYSSIFFKNNEILNSEDLTWDSGDRQQCITDRIVKMCEAVKQRPVTLVLFAQHDKHFATYTARITENGCELLSINSLKGYKDTQVINAVGAGVKQHFGFEDEQIKTLEHLHVHQKDDSSCASVSAALGSQIDPNKTLEEQRDHLKTTIENLVENKRRVREVQTGIYFEIKENNVSGEKLNELRKKWLIDTNRSLNHRDPLFLYKQKELYEEYKKESEQVSKDEEKLPIENYITAIEKVPYATDMDKAYVALLVAKDVYQAQRKSLKTHVAVAILLSVVGLVVPVISHVIIWKIFYNAHKNDVKKLNIKQTLFQQYKAKHKNEAQKTDDFSQAIDESEDSDSVDIYCYDRDEAKALDQEFKQLRKSSPVAG